jgi:predicted ATPase/class 3 adenylate cyclase
MVDGIEPPREEPRLDLPTGTVTFLRTDVEGSMALARAIGARWDAVNATHLGLIRRAVDANGGVCVRTEGDAFFGAFPEAGAGVRAAIEAQRAVTTHAWPDDAVVRVRIGLHSGEAHLAGDDYGGFEVNRAARIAAAGHGGQIVVSEPTRLLAEASHLDGIAYRDLGRHVLRDVSMPERLFQVDVPGLRTEFPPLRTTKPVVGNLPSRVTSFLGREDELEELRGLLETNRLVTLTGPGGIGKTSVAVELARARADAVADGAWFVGLDSVLDAEMVMPAIARTLGLFDGPDRPAAEGLSRYLADRTTLLVLDNFEHVLAAAGGIADIIRASPGTRIIVTSRAPLHLAGEQEYPIRPLPVAGNVSMDLFTQRAQSVRPGWTPGADASAVDEICALLDGLPLGIELAAARVSLLPVTAIRDRLGSRLPLPGSGPRNVPDRQRTLEGAIAWSYDLLDATEQRLLHDLAVFEGGFDVEQAAVVFGGDVLDGLATLVDHSLVAPRSSGDGSVRFGVLQTIRSFALGRLAAEGRESSTRRRHADAYLALAEEAARHWLRADQRRWLTRLALDLGNLRVATRWAIEAGEVDLALRFVSESWRFWQLDGHLAEGREVADAALAMPGADAPTKVRLAAIAAAGGIAYWRADAEAAGRFYVEQLNLARELGDRATEADALFNLSFAGAVEFDPEAAEARANEALSIFRELGNEVSAARITWTLGTVALQRGQAAAAMPVFKEALKTFERTGDAAYHAMASGSLAWSNFFLGDMPEARRWVIRSILEYHALGDIASSTITLPTCALVVLEAGRAEEACLIQGAFEGLSQQYGVNPPIGMQLLLASWDLNGRLTAAMGAEDAAEAIGRGRRMSRDEAIALVARMGEDVDGSNPMATG